MAWWNYYMSFLVSIFIIINNTPPLIHISCVIWLNLFLSWNRLNGRKCLDTWSKNHSSHNYFTKTLGFLNHYPSSIDGNPETCRPNRKLMLYYILYNIYFPSILMVHPSLFFWISNNNYFLYEFQFGSLIEVIHHFYIFNCI